MNKKDLYELFGRWPYRTCRTCGMKKYGIVMKSTLQNPSFNGNDILNKTSRCCRKPNYKW